MLFAKDTLDREVTGIGIVPVLAAAQSPAQLQLFKHVAMAVYPLAHISINNIAAMLCPIDRKPEGMFRRIPADSEPAKTPDGRPELNEIIEKSAELFGDRFIDRHLAAIAECDCLAITFWSDWAPVRGLGVRSGGSPSVDS